MTRLQNVQHERADESLHVVYVQRYQLILSFKDHNKVV